MGYALRNRIIAISVLTIGLLAPLPSIANPDIILGSAIGQLGSTVYIPITYVGNGAVTGIQFDVLFEASQLTSGGQPTADSGLGAHSLNSSLPSQGARRILISPPANNAPLGSGTLGVIPFSLNATATANSKLLTLTNVVISDGNANAVAPTKLSNGLIVLETNLTADTDSDGMPDYWEVTYGLSPIDASDVSQDAENDGLTNLQEYLGGTNPTDPGSPPQTAQTIFDLVARAKDSKIDIIWTPVAGADSYNIYRRTTQGGPYTLIALGHITNYATYADFGLTNDVSYYYVVTSLTNGQESRNSNEASATPAPATRRR